MNPSNMLNLTNWVFNSISHWFVCLVRFWDIYRRVHVCRMILKVLISLPETQLTQIVRKTKTMAAILGFISKIPKWIINPQNPTKFAYSGPWSGLRGDPVISLFYWSDMSPARVLTGRGCWIPRWLLERCSPQKPSSFVQPSLADDAFPAAGAPLTRCCVHVPTTVLPHQCLSSSFLTRKGKQSSPFLFCKAKSEI